MRISNAKVANFAALLMFAAGTFAYGLPTSTSTTPATTTTQHAKSSPPIEEPVLMELTASLPRSIVGRLILDDAARKLTKKIKDINRRLRGYLFSSL